MPNNKERSDRIVECFMTVGEYAGSSGDPTSQVTDILADLRHFCDANDVPFHDCLDTSYIHYLDEK